jgi:transposase
MAVKVRTWTGEEARELPRLAKARTVPHRLGQRAQIIWARAQGRQAPAIARHVGLSAWRVRAWLQRVNRHGLAGLADAARPGRPRRHDESARSAVIALARTKPRRLGYPVALWPLARLPRAIHARVRRQVAQGTIWQWLQAEGLAWKRQQSWFQVTVDAAFVENRGRSSKPIRRRSQNGG